MIGDVNDNPPVFAKPIIRLAIVENLSIGTEVALVEASDADSGKHYGQIRYSLSGQGASDFIIDPSTGQVKVDGEIDFESQPTYNVSVLSHLSVPIQVPIPVMSLGTWLISRHQPLPFIPNFTNSVQLTVMATDAGGLSDRAQLLIEVENLNDNLPSIKAPDVVYLDATVAPGDLVIDLEVRPLTFASLAHGVDARARKSQKGLSNQIKRCPDRRSAIPLCWSLEYPFRKPITELT